MGLLPPKKKEPRQPPVSFRASSSLRDRLKRRGDHLGHSLSKVAETCAEFGLAVWEGLDASWGALELSAKQHGETVPEAIVRLVQAGLAQEKSGKKR